MLELPIFQTFVSHRCSSGQDFPRTHHSIIVPQQTSGFLAVENLDHIAALSFFVAGCDVFIHILRDGMLESAYCYKELVATVHAGVPVISILNEGTCFPDKYKNNTDLFPSNEMIDKTFKGDFLEKV
jgi:hypothetical protein